jgi:hypothetical protein
MAADPGGPLQVTLRLSPTPALVGATRLIIDVVDSEGVPVTGAAVSVEGLPEEGAGRTPPREIAQDEGSGRYVVPGYDLYIRGPWVIAITVADGGGLAITRSFPISVYGER